MCDWVSFVKEQKTDIKNRMKNDSFVALKTKISVIFLRHLTTTFHNRSMTTRTDTIDVTVVSVVYYVQTPDWKVSRMLFLFRKLLLCLNINRLLRNNF